MTVSIRLLNKFKALAWKSVWMVSFYKFYVEIAFWDILI